MNGGKSSFMNILCYNVGKGLVEAIALNFLPKGFKLTTANYL
jgi:hypothetical protein